MLQRPLRLLGLLCLIGSLWGCSRELWSFGLWKEDPVQASLNKARREHVKAHPDISPYRKKQILKGEVSLGMSQEEVKASIGSPSLTREGAKGLVLWAYGPDGAPQSLEDDDLWLNLKFQKGSLVAMVPSLNPLLEDTAWGGEELLQEEVEKKARVDRSMKINQLGVMYYNQGLYDLAIEQYEKALEIDPTNPEAHYNMGYAYIRQGRHNEALEEFKKVVSLNPYDSEAHSNLGLAYYNLGMIEDAIGQYKKAVELDPTDAVAHFNLGYALSGKGRYLEAIEEFKKSIELDPYSSDAHYSLALVYIAKERWEKAKQELEKTLSLESNHPTAGKDLEIVKENLKAQRKKPGDGKAS